jgi:hypothetical protein
MIEVLRTSRELLRRLSFYFFDTLYLLLAVYFSPMVISYHDFLVLFASTS